MEDIFIKEEFLPLRLLFIKIEKTFEKTSGNKVRRNQIRKKKIKNKTECREMGCSKGSLTVKFRIRVEESSSWAR